MSVRGWVAGSVLAMLASLAAPAPAAHADGGWWGDLDKGQGVRLEDVIEAPDRHRGRQLTFTCIFHQQEREFNPLRTRFNSERYNNISVWPDGVPLWKPKSFEGDFPFLYIARTHPHRDALLKLETFTRIEVTARVEAVIDGYPFLELTAVRLTGHRLGPKVVDAMMRGEVYGRSPELEQQSLAAEQFAEALGLQPDLAPIYAQRIRERLAEAYRALGRRADAERVLAGGAAAAGSSFPAPAEPPPTVPPPTAPPPPGGSIPGQPYEAPAPEPGGTLPGTPYEQATPVVAPPARTAPRPALPPEETEPAPAPYVPGQPFAPTLPGVPVDAPTPRAAPAARMPPVPGAARVAVPPAPRAPAVVDPPLPAPPPGGGPPPRKPRLAGVK